MENIRLTKMREYMKEMALSAFIVPSNDPHFGEYIQEHFQSRAWLSGFTGSAATLVVTLNDAALWTDSRYFIQAERELAGSGITLKKLKVEGTESPQQWIFDRLESNQSVGIDSSLFSISEYNSLKISLHNLNIQLCNDPFSTIRKDRPLLKFNPISLLDVEYAGETTSSKHKRFIDELNIDIPFLYIVSACDEIAWLCNIRGTDIPFNPLPLSFAAISRDSVFLFINSTSLSSQDKRALEKEGIIVLPYLSFASFISEYPSEILRVASPDKTSVLLYNCAVKTGARFQFDQSRGGVISILKAIKNDVEQQGFRDAMLYDGVAWVKTLYRIDRLMTNKDRVTEGTIAELFKTHRSLNPLYRGESFAPIVAYGANAALPHYSISEDEVVIEAKGLLLMDTGAQYLCGTTDTTRTIKMGELTEEQMRDYTLILKGMIALTNAKFLKGTRGSQLDILARGPISSCAKIYMHGTGHGIGHYLCVHEGPQSIRMEENPVAIEPGMVISNEPAVYQEGEYGIRIENILLCRDWEAGNFGSFYKFETLTLVPIDTRPILTEYLCDKDIIWINEYNQKVYERLSPYLTKDEDQWLSDACKKLN